MGMARKPFGPASTAAPWRTAVAGVLTGLLVGTAAFAPASWLATAVSTASGHQVQLTNARGSIWQGSSQLALSGGAGSDQAVALPGQIHWQVHPDWAGLLAGLGTPWNTVQPQGQLVTSSQNVAMEWEKGRMRLSGQLQVDALRMSSRLSTLSPMGSYRITVQGGSEPTLQLATLEGSLQLSGQGQWIAQRLRFNGVASADPARVEALSNLLNIVGRRDGARSIITVG
jgi:general secretion pathway protein N